MKDKKTFKLRLKREMQWYSFLIVSIIALVLLTYIPMLTTIKYSFTTPGYCPSEENLTGLPTIRS